MKSLSSQSQTIAILYYTYITQASTSTATNISTVQSPYTSLHSFYPFIFPYVSMCQDRAYHTPLEGSLMFGQLATMASGASPSTAVYSTEKEVRLVRSL